MKQYTKLYKTKFTTKVIYRFTGARKKKRALY